MTEAEWLACDHSQAMLESLEGKASDRKLRLFTVACCRAVWEFLVDDRSRKAIDAVERLANGELFEEERENHSRAARAAFGDAITPLCRDAHGPRTATCAGAKAAWLALFPSALEAAARAAYQCANAARRAPRVQFLAAWAEAYRKQAYLLREIVGNPFRPIAFEPAWLSSDVLLLAQGIYDEKVFDRMPILADALQDAGCNNPDVLDHCREPGEHVRGCWVIDGILGKS
jgi:hypothetical protein